MADLAIKLNLNEDNQPIFHTNETLTGIVEVSLSDQTLITCVHIIVHGYGRTHWKETKTVTRNERKVTVVQNYEGREEYLNTSMNLLGELGGHPMLVPAGVRRYNISVPLRDSLPSSYVGAEYEINYYVIAILDIPNRASKKVKEYFTVVQEGDPSLYSELLVPVEYEKIKRLCCLFCRSAPCIISVTLPYSVFTVGHAIPIKFKYVNKSDGAIFNTVLQLKRKIEYKASTPEAKTKSGEEVVAQKIERGVGARRVIEFEMSFDIPANLPPSNEKFCDIISITYKLLYKAEFTGCHLDVEREFPIIILGKTSRANTNISNSTVPSIMPTAPRDENDDDLPPSFDEAVKMMKPQYAPSTARNENVGWNVMS